MTGKERYRKKERQTERKNADEGCKWREVVRSLLQTQEQNKEEFYDFPTLHRACNNGAIFSQRTKVRVLS